MSKIIDELDRIDQYQQIPDMHWLCQDDFAMLARLVRQAHARGYITEAGQCLVMQAKIAGRKLIMVFLDSAGKLSRIGDAERVRKWVENKSAFQSSSKQTFLERRPG